MLLHEFLHIADELVHPQLCVLQLLPQTQVLLLQRLQRFLQLLGFSKDLRDILLTIRGASVILEDNVLDLLCKFLLS